MRVSRFTQLSLMAIALFPSILLGVSGCTNIRHSVTGVAPTPLNLISQDLSPKENVEANPQRSRPGEFLRSLNLSRRQKRQLFRIRDQYQSEIRLNRTALRSDMAQLRQLMISDAPTSEVTAQFANVQNSRKALNEENFKSYLEIREVLTLEQREIFSEQLQSRRQSRGR